MGSPAKNGRSFGKESNGQYKLYDHRESSSNAESDRVDALGKRGTSGREGRKQWWWKRWQSKWQRWRWQGRQSNSGNSGTLSWMWGPAFSQRMPSIYRPDNLPELLQTGTSQKPLSQHNGRRYDCMQVLRRSRAQQKRTVRKTQIRVDGARYEGTQKKCVVAHRDMCQRKNTY